MDCTCTIDHVIILFDFVTDQTQSDRSRQLDFIFDVNWIYTISHVVVLSDFCHSWNSIRSVNVTQFHFWHKLHLYNQLRHCPIWFSSQLALDPIGHNNLVSFLVYTTPVQAITLLSNLILIIDDTQSDWS